MRTFITTIKQKITLRSSSIVVSVLLSIVAIPAAVLAYGPDRPTFTMANPATYVTFNSITDDPAVGDERNFFRVRDTSTGEAFGDAANLVAGHNYEATVFFHNNAASNLNLIATNAAARVELPAVIGARTSDTKAEAFVSASNANPATVFDYITFNNSGDGDIAIRTIDNTAKITSKGAVNGQAINEDALFGSGAPLGFSSLDGTLPGCDHYAGYITFAFTAVQPNFTFAKNVRLDGSGVDGWKNNLSVNQGAVVNYQLAYDNTGNTTQTNVTLRDKLPAGVTYIPGTAKIYDANSPNGKTLDDSIAGEGTNIGTYANDTNAYLDFSARIDAAPCTVLTNTATATTTNGTLSASATVTVAGNCAAVLPTTGPAEVIAGLLGVGAITFGVVYYLKSRRDLENALLHTQTHPTTVKTHPKSAPEASTTIAEVDAELHNPKTSEHKK